MITRAALVPIGLVAVSAAAIAYPSVRCIDQAVELKRPTLERIMAPEPDLVWLVEPKTGCLRRSPPPLYGPARHCYGKVVFPDGGQAW